MGPARQESSVRFRVSLDGQPPGAAHGLDVDEAGNGTVVEQRLYQLIRQARPVIDRTFQIEFLDVVWRRSRLLSADSFELDTIVQ